MKKTPFSFYLFILFATISCEKENLNKPSLAKLNESSNAVKTNAHYIGERFGGGIIFCLDAQGKHGLISDTSDLGMQPWYAGSYIETFAKDTSIGSGAFNTRKIKDVQGKYRDYAALICAHYKGSGYVDWYLPSEGELIKLWESQSIIGGFKKGTYWSSSEYNQNSAWGWYFPQGIREQLVKDAFGAVRAIRAF